MANFTKDQLRGMFQGYAELMGWTVGDEVDQYNLRFESGCVGVIRNSAGGGYSMPITYSWFKYATLVECMGFAIQSFGYKKYNSGG